MRQIPLTPQIALIAKRIIWFEPPAAALFDPVRFMAYAMARASHKDMQVIRRYVSWEDFLEALDRAPPGIIDAGHGLTGTSGQAAIPRRLCRKDSCSAQPWREGAGPYRLQSEDAAALRLAKPHGRGSSWLDRKIKLR